VSHKNVTKVVWYILVQLSSLNNAWFKGSTFQVQRLDNCRNKSSDVRGNRGQQREIGHLNPETSEPRTLNL
jgi:hypothetical protein